MRFTHKQDFLRPYLIACRLVFKDLALITNLSFLLGTYLRICFIKHMQYIRIARSPVSKELIYFE